jgi:hypothetical protein
METKNKVRTEEYMRRKGYPPVGSHPSSISSAALSEINRLLGHWDDDRRRRKVPDWMSRYWYKHCRCSGSGTGTQASKQVVPVAIGHWLSVELREAAKISIGGTIGTTSGIGTPTTSVEFLECYCLQLIAIVQVSAGAW